jgi:hypothetical protein
MTVGTRAVTAVAGMFAGVALVVGAGVAAADPSEGGCPKRGGWILVSTALLSERQGNARDENDNGLVCLKRQCDGPSDCTVRVKDDIYEDEG